MSSKDRKRAEATGMVMRSGHFEAVTSLSINDHIKPLQPQYLRCGKCGHIIAESFITEHLVGNEKRPGCQPLKTECGKCKQFIPSIDFLKHFKGCKGKEVKDDNKNQTPAG